MPKEKETVIVDGFRFESGAEAVQAKKEQEGVKYIRNKVDMDNPEMVLQIYNKMLKEELFETAVGYAYLKDLQEYLQTIPFIKNEDIRPISVKHPTFEKSIRGEQKQKAEDTKKEVKERKKEAIQLATISAGGEKMKKYYKTSLLFNLVLAVCVVAMFVITMTSSSPNIINYETKIIDRYAEWEQELTDRELTVKIKEQELNITPEE